MARTPAKRSSPSVSRSTPKRLRGKKPTPTESLHRVPTLRTREARVVLTGKRRTCGGMDVTKTPPRASRVTLDHSVERSRSEENQRRWERSVPTQDSLQVLTNLMPPELSLGQKNPGRPKVLGVENTIDISSSSEDEEVPEAGRLGKRVLPSLRLHQDRKSPSRATASPSPLRSILKRSPMYSPIKSTQKKRST